MSCKFKRVCRSGEVMHGSMELTCLVKMSWMLATGKLQTFQLVEGNRKSERYRIFDRNTTSQVRNFASNAME